MAKASLTLPDGTTVLIEGSADEIQKIISLHRPQTTPPQINGKEIAHDEVKTEKKGLQRNSI